jgi:hypothetical protein
MPDRLRVYRAEPGPPTAPKGVLFGTDDRGRSRYLIVDRSVALEVLDELSRASREVVWWTRERAGLVPR